MKLRVSDSNRMHLYNAVNTQYLIHNTYTTKIGLNEHERVSGSRLGVGVLQWRRVGGTGLGEVACP